MTTQSSHLRLAKYIEAGLTGDRQRQPVLIGKTSKVTAATYVHSLEKTHISSRELRRELEMLPLFNGRLPRTINNAFLRKCLLSAGYRPPKSQSWHKGQFKSFWIRSES